MNADFRVFEENIARQRSPISKEMFVAMANHACDSDRDSVESVTFNWITLGRVAGFRVAEYAQTTQNKVDEFEYASGNRVIKAFVSSDWTFYNKKGRLKTVHSLDGLGDPPAKVKLIFQIQKNRRNGQNFNFVADDKHPDICPVRAAYQIFLRVSPKFITTFSMLPDPIPYSESESLSLRWRFRFLVSRFLRLLRLLFESILYLKVSFVGL